jgi:hypothetical protein
MLRFFFSFQYFSKNSKHIQRDKDQAGKEETVKEGKYKEIEKVSMFAYPLRYAL